MQGLLACANKLSENIGREPEGRNRLFALVSKLHASLATRPREELDVNEASLSIHRRVHFVTCCIVILASHYLSDVLYPPRKERTEAL